MAGLCLLVFLPFPAGHRYLFTRQPQRGALFLHFHFKRAAPWFPPCLCDNSCMSWIQVVCVCEVTLAPQCVCERSSQFRTVRSDVKVMQVSAPVPSITAVLLGKTGKVGHCFSWGSTLRKSRSKNNIQCLSRSLINLAFIHTRVVVVLRRWLSFNSFISQQQHMMRFLTVVQHQTRLSSWRHSLLFWPRLWSHVICLGVCSCRDLNKTSCVSSFMLLHHVEELNSTKNRF